MDQIGEGIRKLILAGIGAAAMTKEKSEGILQELVKKGELTVEQGKVLNEELKHDLKQAIRENVTVNVVRPQAEDVMQAVDHMDDEALEALKQKIAQAQAARKVCLVLLAGALLILAGLVVQAEPQAGGVSVYSLICFLLAAGLSAAAFFKPRGRG